MLHRSFDLEDMLAQLKAYLESAYNAGYADGARDTRDAILRAAQAPADIDRSAKNASQGQERNLRLSQRDVPQRGWRLS